MDIVVNEHEYFDEYTEKEIEQDIVELQGPKIKQKNVVANNRRKRNKRKAAKMMSIERRRQNSPGITDVTKPWKRQFFEVRRKSVTPSKEPVLGIRKNNGIKPTVRNK